MATVTNSDKCPGFEDCTCERVPNATFHSNTTVTPSNLSAYGYTYHSPGECSFCDTAANSHATTHGFTPTVADPADRAARPTGSDRPTRASRKGCDCSADYHSATCASYGNPAHMPPWVD